MYNKQTGNWHRWPVRFVGGPQDGRVDLFDAPPPHVYRFPPPWSPGFIAVTPPDNRPPSPPRVIEYRLVRPGDAVTLSGELVARLGWPRVNGHMRYEVLSGRVGATEYRLLGESF